LAVLKNHHPYPLRERAHWFATVRDGGNSIAIISNKGILSMFCLSTGIWPPNPNRQALAAGDGDFYCLIKHLFEK